MAMTSPTTACPAARAWYFGSIRTTKASGAEAAEAPAQDLATPPKEASGPPPSGRRGRRRRNTFPDRSPAFARQWSSESTAKPAGTVSTHSDCGSAVPLAVSTAATDLPEPTSRLRQHGASGSTTSPESQAEPGWDGLDYKEFEIDVLKDEDQLGVDVLQHMTGSLLISRVRPGSVQSWNQRRPDMAVQAGDRIVEVNGQRGPSAQLVSAIRSEWRLHLLIRRQLKFSVSLPEFSGQLGLDIAMLESALKVLKVKEGPIKDWNASCAKDIEVMPEDSIVEVNGVKGSPADLLQAIRSQQGQRLDLAFSRSPVARTLGAGTTNSRRAPVQPQSARERVARALEESPPPTSPGRSRNLHVTIQVW